MNRTFKVLKKEATYRENIQGSIFIAQARKISSKEEAKTFIEEVRKKHNNATHNTYGYVLGDILKGSDDGEPSSTAGKPIIENILGQGYIDTCVVVTRYFGGTLLGTRWIN